MKRVDAHVHAFPDRLALAVRNQLNSSGLLTGGALLPDVAAQVEAAGFDRAWVLPYAHRAGVAGSVNEWSAREVTRFPRLVAGATFHPDDPDIARLVERAFHELGLRVVKLHCSVGGFSPADPRLEPLWREAAIAGVPVVVHAGQRAPGDTAADEVDRLASVLAAHPALKLVLAHAGHSAVARTLELMAVHPNLYADLTPVWMTPTPITAEGLRRFPGRFLFGSDSPNCPLSTADQEAGHRAFGLPDTEFGLLMGGAAERLLPGEASGYPSRIEETRS